MHDKEETPEAPACSICDASMLRVFGAPVVLRASFAEGQGRGERWSLLKKSAKLEQQASHLRKNGKREEAQEMRQESQKLNKLAAGARDKTDT